jgi:hypothetical protein
LQANTAVDDAFGFDESILKQLATQNPASTNPPNDLQQMLVEVDEGDFVLYFVHYFEMITFFFFFLENWDEAQREMKFSPLYYLCDCDDLFQGPRLPSDQWIGRNGRSLFSVNLKPRA